MNHHFIKHAIQLIAVCLFVGGFGGSIVIGQSLRDRIDRATEGGPSFLNAPQVQDGFFLRRLSLDLRNAVPTSTELKEFLDDPDPKKRDKWIERFVADPLYDERMVTWLDLTLMERRPATNVDRQAWLQWLRSKVDEGTTLDTFAKLMVGSEWWVKEGRPQQRFFLDRDGDPNLATRDFGRIFLGRDLQCAQCHDHPSITDYRQRDYHGLLAFFSSGSLVEVTYKDAERKDQKMKLYVEKAASDAPFESVFIKGKQHWAGPALLDRLPKWEGYTLPTDRYKGPASDWIVGDSPKRPADSRRQDLATLLVDPSFRPFAENWSNRLWAMLMGEGIVQPLDMHHPDNPPDNPELLKILADGLIELRFDVKAFIKEIVKTQVYQRSNSMPWEPSPESLLAIDFTQLLQESEALKVAAIAIEAETKSAKETWTNAIDALHAEEAEHVRLRAELAKSDAALLDAIKKSNDGNKARDAASQNLANAKQRQQLLTEAISKLEEAKKLGPKEDPELTAAIQGSTAKRDAANASLPALETALTTAQTKVDTLKAAEQTAQKGASDQALLLAGVREPIERLTQEVLMKRDAWRIVEQKKKGTQSRANFVTLVLDWRSTMTEHQTVAQKIPTFEKSIADAQQQVEDIQRKSKDLARQLASVEAEKSTQTTALAASQGRSDKLQAELNQLASAKTQLETTLNLLSSNSALGMAVTELTKGIEQRQKELEPITKELEAGRLTLQRVETKVAAILKEQALMAEQLKGLHAIKSEADRLLAVQQESLKSLASKVDEFAQKVVEANADQLAVSRLRPLSPEQLCWSYLRVMGVFDSYVQAEMALLAKGIPLPIDPPPSNEEKVERERIAVRRAIDKLRGNADQFAKLFASGSGQSDSYFASVDQALYLANGGAVYSWSGSNGSNLTARIASAKDLKVAAEDLYQTLLCRKPTPEETITMEAMLNVPQEKRGANAQVAVWVVLSGAEFRFIQ